MPSIVTHGVYFGFTLAELEAELIRYKAAVSAAGSDVVSESIAGESFSYGPRRDMSLDQWQAELQTALYMVDPDNYQLPLPDRGGIRIV